jgi:hypothetical protein
VAVLGCLAPAANAGGPSSSAGIALELLPDHDGSSRLRTRFLLATEHRPAPGWEAAFSASFRLSSHLAAPLGTTGGFDLHAGSMRYRSALATVAVGRLAGPSIGTRLDGVEARIGQPRDLVSAVLFGGRRAHVEAGFFGASMLVGGGEVRVAPRGRSGRWGGTVLHLGAEARYSASGPSSRIFGGARSVFAGGAAGAFTVETRTGTASLVPLRAAMSVAVPLADAHVSSELRWEGLPADVASLRTPWDFLTPYGYAALRVALSVRVGEWDVSGSGGPSARPVPGGVAWGGIARVDVSRSGRHLRAGGYVIAAAASPGNLFGGGAFAAISARRLAVTADLGVFAKRPFAGAYSPVVEARARAEWRPGGSGLRLAAEAAAGADRLRAPYARGGLLAIGEFGPRRPLRGVL